MSPHFMNAVYMLFLRPFFFSCGGLEIWRSSLEGGRGVGLEMEKRIT